MSEQRELPKELQQSIHDGNAVLVAGTGVSIASSYDMATGKVHPQASWLGLLEHGIHWLQEHQLIADHIATAHLSFYVTPIHKPITSYRQHRI